MKVFVRAYSVPLAVACASALATTGCQSTLKVSVHRVIVPTSQRLQPESPLGQAVTGTVAALTKLEAACADASLKANAVVLADPELRGPLARYMDELVQTAKKAGELRETALKLMIVPDITQRKEDVRDMLAKVRLFMKRSGEQMDYLRQEFSQIPRLEALCTDNARGPVTDLWKAGRNAERVTEEGKKAATVTKGFGGFVATDWYEIKPSDPNFRDIFATRPSGRLVHTEPITEAEIGASGDSNMMIVIEHPGQARVYQVSNDPSQLTRNIGILVSKATAAMAKFATVGVP